MRLFLGLCSQKVKKMPAIREEGGLKDPQGLESLLDGALAGRRRGEFFREELNYFFVSVKLWQLLHISSGCLAGLSALWHSTQLTAPRWDMCGFGTTFLVFSARAS